MVDLNEQHPMAAGARARCLRATRFVRTKARLRCGAIRRTSRVQRERGMTLIEILVVLVLIGIVLGIVGGNFIGRGEKAKGDAAKIEIGQISQALDLFKLETGRYPTSQEGLQALIQSPTGINNWNGP